MGWSNPPIPWHELERRLSGRVPPADAPVSRRKQRYRPREGVVAPDTPAVPWVELHCHSHFSFLDGASSPEELVEEAVRLGLSGLALTDHDGFAGAPAFAEAARAWGMTTVYGAELSLGLPAPQQGVADPAGEHLLVLARGVAGYHRLAAAITEANLRPEAEKGRPVHLLDELAERGRGHWVVLTGCRKGFGDPDRIDLLVDRFGSDSVFVELTSHGLPTDDETNDRLWSYAQERGLPTVATGNAHYARPDQYHLASAMAAIRARRSIADLDGWLPPWGGACLRSGAEMAQRFARYPGSVERTVDLAADLAFDLQKATPRLPKLGIPADHTPATWLRVLVEEGFEKYYRGQDHEAAARERIEHELRIICDKDFAGYFTIVHDIVAFARSQGILCQGRGSAAASAVCYALGITAIDSVYYRLPFERFISAHRDTEPDIDVDFDSDRREEVIQWVYQRYGRRNAAQVANVITYRPKMAIRDAAKALGYSPGQQDAWSKGVDSWSSVPTGGEGADHIPAEVVDLARQLHRAPRHLGIHSGGMILTERPIGEVCPIEPARMPNRTVIQWDKDAAEYMGLVKFDLLGLGMLGALNQMIGLIAEHTGVEWTLQTIPKEDPAVYDMLGVADSIGVFQVESRAQIGTLPRLKPRSFYDLACEIALIRPGPIQGGAVHPYIRRKTGKEPVSYAHPDLIPVLERTLGVPLFQEQLMHMAMAIGDCNADEADLLRRAMGSKRGIERIEKVKQTLYAGMARRGITGGEADAIYQQILSFASFGFAESHALSFALLVYASSWFKRYYPATFLVGLLRSQPMGFYSPQSLVQDARRHGVVVRRPSIVDSEAMASLAPHPDTGPADRKDAGFLVQLGLDSVRGIGTTLAERIVAEREREPFADLVDLSRRASLEPRHLEALATAGAFDCWGLERREALWQAGFTERADHLAGSSPTTTSPPLVPLDQVGTTLADLWATSITPESHAFEHLRPSLSAGGILAISALAEVADRRRVHVAGLVTHRQRPGTAGGVTFLNLEDETGMLNVVCGEGLWRRYRNVARNSASLVVRGLLERRDGVTNLVADKLVPLEEVFSDAGRSIGRRHRSRDFQ